MQKIVTFHIDEYGDEPEVCAAAPGRFHLLGEHTWFAQGNTLSMSINHYLYACASRRSDNNFRLLMSGKTYLIQVSGIRGKTDGLMRLRPLFRHLTTSGIMFPA